MASPVITCNTKCIKRQQYDSYVPWSQYQQALAYSYTGVSSNNVLLILIQIQLALVLNALVKLRKRRLRQSWDGIA